jgi:SOS-response transcriptional repressor LexA
MEPDFREGEKIVVDPALQPISGDFVVVEILAGNKVPGEGDIVFKQYRARGPEAFDLVPLNADFPTVTVNAGNPGRIIGKVVEHHRILTRS